VTVVMSSTETIMSGCILVVEDDRATCALLAGR
jgi:hypothetical protein